MIKEYTLLAADVDRMSGELQSELSRCRLSEKDVQRIRLSAEECLNRYAAHFAGDVPVTLRIEKHFLEYRISVSVRCAEWNVLADKEDEFRLLDRLMGALSVAPSWSYAGGVNTVSYTARPARRVPDYVFYIAAVVLGLGGGWLMQRFFPGDAAGVCASYLAPVSDALMGFLNSLAVVMVFTSIVTGITAMGDVRTFRKIGLRMIGRFFCILLGCLLFVTALTLLFFPLRQNDGVSVNAAALWQMIVSIVPTNVFSAFASGNVLQVIFLSVFSGVVLLAVSAKAEGVTNFIGQANRVVHEMLRIAVVPMPLVVFINLFEIAALGELAGLSRVYQYVLIMLICCAAMTVFSVLRVCRKQRVSPALLIRKLYPTWAMAFLTASSSAAYSTNVRTCEQKLGIDKSISSIGIPLGQIVFKPCTVFQPICGCLCFAALYGVDISLPKLVTLMITVLILAVAEPPVPGVLVCCFTLLFAQIDVPMEALSVILALDCILDRFGTATNLLSLQAELVQFSGSTGKLRADVLHKG